MASTIVQQYAARRPRQGYPAGEHRTRRAALGLPIIVGVFTLLCMGAPAPAEEPTSRGEPQGILAAIAVPNFITYRTSTRIASSVGTTESIRAAVNARTGLDPLDLDGTDDEEDSARPIEQGKRSSGDPASKKLVEIGVGREP